MDKVVVSKCMIGVYGMQVCAEPDATDEEILHVCNTENPAGTTNGWGIVVRENNLEENNMGENCAPVQCEDDECRLHFLVLC